MHLTTNLKLGEVNNLSDARYAAGVGAQFVGFNLSPNHPSYIAPTKAQEIMGWIEGIIPVAEWGNEPAEVISDTCERLGIHYVQLNYCDPQCSMALAHLKLIQNIVLGEGEGLSSIISTVDHVQRYTNYYMLSFVHEQAQEAYLSNPAHQLMLLEFCRDYPVLLNFYFTPENLTPIMERYKPFGINLKGGMEDKPGYKDFDTLNELVQLLEK